MPEIGSSERAAQTDSAVTVAPEEIAIRDVPERARYELAVNGELAGFLRYRLQEDRITLVHTEVDAQWDGRGLGSRLARHALDDARARGLVISVRCPFVRSYVRRHPEFADLVAD
jgi:predicted GNAT family acetyltransferase